MSFGNRLAELRISRNLNKSELAKILGVTHPQVIRYERDETLPPMEKLKFLASFFGVSMDYLFDDLPSNQEFEQNALQQLDRLPLKHKRKVFEYIELLSLKYKSGK